VVKGVRKPFSKIKRPRQRSDEPNAERLNKETDNGRLFTLSGNFSRVLRLKSGSAFPTSRLRAYCVEKVGPATSEVKFGQQ
jgi:hypothetical protein